MCSSCAQMSAKEREARVVEILDIMKLTHARHTRSSNLSGGERRRLGAHQFLSDLASTSASASAKNYCQLRVTDSSNLFPVLETREALTRSPCSWSTPFIRLRWVQSAHTELCLYGATNDASPLEGSATMCVCVCVQVTWRRTLHITEQQAHA